MSSVRAFDPDRRSLYEDDNKAPRPFWVRYRTGLLLALILILAAAFRFYGRDFDQGHNQHPDERAIVSRTLTVNWPASFNQLLDPKTSPLNLRSTVVEANCPPDGCRYPWGSLPVYISRAAAWLLDTVLPPTPDRPQGYYLQNYQAATLVGRSVASVFDLLTILLVFLIARRLFSSATALIATALVAFAVTQIQIAHFYISEPFLVTFMVGGLYFSIVLMQRPSWWAAAAAGACVGLATASKVTIAPVFLMVIAAVLLRAAYRRHTRKLGAELGDPVGVRPASATERERTFRGHSLRGLRYVLIAAIFAVIFFSVSEPYVLWTLDFSHFQFGGGKPFDQALRDGLSAAGPWTRGIVEEAGIQSGADAADIPYTRQYIGTVPVLYQFEQLVLWGMGVIPGLVALAGLVLALWRAIRGKPAEIILLSAGIPYFLTILTGETKWMRYMLPLVPIMAILGAAMLVRGTAWARARFPRLTSERGFGLRSMQRGLFPTLIALSVGFAFLWSLAYMNIYSQDHSRVQASAWIYSNVPDGSSISSEFWDDAIPFDLPAVPGQPPRQGGARGFSNVGWGLYDDRAPDEELRYITDQMHATDYIVLTSNRLYGSIPRLPWRYPVQTRFYQLLFAEKLGYVRVHTSLVTPLFLGIAVNDQLADESFTVYDHPRVDVFKKVTELTDGQLRTLFSTALDRPLGQYSTARHGTVDDDKSLMLDQPLSQQPVVDDLSWNPLAQPDTQWIGLVIWLLAVYILGALALPITFTVFRRLPDRGYPLARLVALLLVSWGAWILASFKLMPFTVWSVLLVTLLMGGASLLVWRLGVRAEIRDFFRLKKGLVAFYEIVFLFAFAAFLVVRIINPDLWHTVFGGEKTMEFGFLNSILRSPWMPPADPFFAGGVVNYYYHGQFIIACLIKLVGMAPSLAFNLAIPLLFALTFTAAGSVVYNIVAWSQRRRGGAHHVSRAGIAFALLAGVLTLVIGNLHALMQVFMIYFPQTTQNFIQWAQELNFVGPSWTSRYVDFNFWDPSRIIDGTINEFPYWSFLYADLHPHLIDMPFTLMAAAFGVNVAFAGRFSPTGGIRRGWAGLRGAVRESLAWLWGAGWRGGLSFGVMAVSLGALFAVNSWDFPTFFGLFAGSVFVALLLSRAVWFVSRRGEPVDAGPRDARIGVGGGAVLALTAGVSVAVLAGVSLLAYVPFFLNFKAFYTKILPLVDGARIENSADFMHRTTLAEFLVVWAIFVFIAVSYLLMRLWTFPWGEAFAGIGRFFTRPSEEPAQIAPAPATFAVRTGGARLRPHTLAYAGAGSGSPAGPVLPFATRGVEDAPRPDLTPDSADETSLSPSEGNPQLVSPELEEEVSPFDASEHEEVQLGEPIDRSLPAIEPQPSEEQSSNWVAQAHTVAHREVLLDSAHVQPGVIPAWAGLGMLAVTAALVALQIATGQLLLALLVALIGGITSTLLASTRSAAALAGGVLVVGGLLVTMGVELVYLADHLAGGSAYRMNTVFKFYIQAWVLLATGCAVAVYYIFYGIRERRERSSFADSRELTDFTTSEDYRPAEPVLPSAPVPPEYSPSAVETTPIVHVQPAQNDQTRLNWLVWSAEDIERAPGNLVALPDESLPVVVASAEPQFAERALDVTTAPLRPVVEDMGVPTRPLGVTGLPSTSIRWNIGRAIWAVLFAGFMAVSLIFPVWGTPARLKWRMSDNPAQLPPLGTLDGLDFMKYATFSSGEVPYPVTMRYDYEGIQWLNTHVQGLATIVESPSEYYRAGGMRVASYTGLPMVIGGLHQEEQRAGVYARLVGDRRNDVFELLSTSDVQRALTIINKYDVDYIYLGQLEQAKAGEAGMRKFEQMADAKVGILREVFRTDTPSGVAGTIIYRVVRGGDNDPKLVVGAPVQGSGIPGISITPLPTSTPVPPPTPPVDDPELKALIDAVAAAPNDRDKRLNLVQWYQTHGYPLEAAKEIETLVKQDPTNVTLRQMLGDMYQAAGRLDEALKAWEDCVKVAPNNPDAHNKLGIAYMDRKRYDDALTEFQAAVKANSSYLESWFHMGEVYERKGDVEGAKRAYQSVLDNSREPNSWQAAAQGRLNQLK